MVANGRQLIRYVNVEVSPDLFRRYPGPVVLSLSTPTGAFQTWFTTEDGKTFQPDSDKILPNLPAE